MQWEKRLGPVLYARPDDGDHWSFDVGLLLSSAAAGLPPVEIVVEHEAKGAKVTGPEKAADFGEAVYWRWRIRLTRAAQETLARYRVRPTGGSYVSSLEGDYTVVVPARGQLPRLLFFSCNGFSEAKYAFRVADAFASWKRALREHKKAAGIPLDEGESEDGDQSWKATPANANLRGGYHVMIGGGDQVYADSLWYEQTLDDLRLTAAAARPHWQPPTGFADAMLKAFVDLYALRWGRPEFAAALARIPGVFTWDDHDIFDGWGSYADELQQCAAYQGIFTAAATTFDAFQLGGRDRPLCTQAAAPHRLQAVSFAGTDAAVDVLLLDLRSERSLGQVLSEAQWTALNEWMADWRRSETGPRHLLVVSGIPLVHLRFTAWQEEIGTLGELDDDMRDQWESPLHRGERSRLIMRLLTHANLEHVQATILSGDVHVAAHGRIVSRNPNHLAKGQSETWMEQLTSSGIVHPPPLPWESLALRAAGRESDDDIDPYVVTKLLSVGGQRYLQERNWLSLDFDVTRDSNQVRNRLWAQWWGEDSGAIEPQVVIEAVAPAPKRSGATGKAATRATTSRATSGRRARRLH